MTALGVCLRLIFKLRLCSPGWPGTDSNPLPSDSTWLETTSCAHSVLTQCFLVSVQLGHRDGDGNGSGHSSSETQHPLRHRTFHVRCVVTQKNVQKVREGRALEKP